MKPWNPYAMTFHGQPITGQTPPKLVVYGPPLTAQQGAMLQTAYNAFVGAARVSIVPNPTRQGRLLDGSPYTIECSHGACTCTVWTAERAATQEEVFSGILFWNQRVVIVNQGGVNDPTAKWTIKDVTSHPFASAYTGMTISGLTAQVPYRSGVTANTSITLAGKAKFVYQSLWIGHYGNMFYESDWRAIGISNDGRAIMAKNGGSELKIAVSSGTDFKTKLLPFGSPASETLDWLEPLAGSETIVSKSDPTTADPQKLYQQVTAGISKNGKRILFIESLLSDKTTPEDAITRYPDGTSSNIIEHKKHHVNFASADADTGFLSYNVASGSYLWTHKKYESAVKRATIGADGSLSSVETVYQIPADFISTPDKVSATWSNTDKGIYMSTHIDCDMTDAYAPPIVASPYVDWDGPYWYVRGSSVAAGPIRARLSRTEKQNAAYPHFVGNTAVMLPYTREFDYSENMTGSVSISAINGVWAYGEDAYGGPPPLSQFSDSFPSGAEREERTLSYVSTTSNVTNEYYTLNDGTKFFIKKDTYSEVGEAAYTYTKSAVSPAFTETTHQQDLSYTITREYRDLLVYDPTLKLLCYTETKYSATKSFWQSTNTHTTTGNTYTNSGGGVAPVIPPTELVIECGGETQRFPWPSRTGRKNSGYLLPPTGISPWATINGDIKTSSGFVAWQIASSPGLTTRSLSIPFDPSKEIGRRNLTPIRGLMPPMFWVIGNADTEYVKTPETGAAYLRVKCTDGDEPADMKFLIDSAGARLLEDVLPELDIGETRGKPF